jgi:mono/diheme cytochrome c family protein
MLSVALPSEFPMRFCWIIAFFFVARVVAAPEPASPLVWDAMEKTLEVKPGDGAADFEFHVTNKSDRPVEIIEVRPSCGCTVAEMPSKPWILAPGANGSFRGTIDFRGKHGKVSKSLFVNSSAGTQVLGIVVNLPEKAPSVSRDMNQALAAHDRQAVFKGDCASCHAAPAQGKKGGELFVAVCGVCHMAEHRASMVPDLMVAREPRDAEFWRKWISEGKEGTLMPAFAKAHDGPLTDEQIASLVEFALKGLPTQPRKE